MPTTPLTSDDNIKGRVKKYCKEVQDTNAEVEADVESELQDIAEMEPLPLKSEVLQAMKSIRKEKASGSDVRSEELVKSGSDMQAKFC